MIEHFDHGYITLAVAFAVSMSGSALGLLLSRQARLHTGTRRRVQWLLPAAFAIGGTGIWVMHFVAMLGFDVDGAILRYDPLMTAASALIAIAVVACGLLVIGLGRITVGRFALAGLFTGGGVAAMHYTGMAAIDSTIELHHDPAYVASAIAIAIGASTTALWLALRLQKTAAMWLAAAVMAIAVNAMHYTAMLGVRAGEATGDEVHGAHSIELIFPMAVLTAVVLLFLIYTVITAPSASELHNEARLEALQESFETRLR
ncbi:MHYT domain-containing protein [Glycomyces salinus]|uniref:MHYT domain-containing protein n=1 Tax=Glycomyces salinus TaxID=980294 RepID=UPI0018EC259E|nr:MHYT domain-containing protein [Glycomyces salinus]